MRWLCRCRLPMMYPSTMWKRIPAAKRKRELQRDVIRSGVVTISVSFSVSPVWLKRLTAYSKKPKIAVQYFDTEDLALKGTEMYITGYQAKLEKDTSYKGLWTVSFTLNEL